MASSISGAAGIFGIDSHGSSTYTASLQEIYHQKQTPKRSITMIRYVLVMAVVFCL